MDFRNESPVVDLSVKKHHSPSPRLNHGPLLTHNSHAGHAQHPPPDRPHDLSAKGVPYFMQPFDPLHFANFNFYQSSLGLNLSKVSEKPITKEVNGERSSRKTEKKSGIPEKYVHPAAIPERYSHSAGTSDKFSNMGASLDKYVHLAGNIEKYGYTAGMPEKYGHPTGMSEKYGNQHPEKYGNQHPEKYGNQHPEKYGNPHVLQEKSSGSADKSGNLDPDSPERRRSLRPRAEVKYNVSPIPLLPEEVYALNGGYTNGIASDSEDDDSKPLPHLPLPKEIPPEELRQKQKIIKKLQAELRQEEMLLYLLRGLKQSQSKPPPVPEPPKEQPPPPKELPKTLPTHSAHPFNMQLIHGLPPHSTHPFNMHLFQGSPSIPTHPYPQLANLAAGQSSRIGSVDISPVPPKGSTFHPKSGNPVPSPLASFSKVTAGAQTPPNRTSSVPSPLIGLGFKDELPMGLSITPKGSNNTNHSVRSARATPPVTPSDERMNKFSVPNQSLQSVSSRSEDPQVAAQRQAAAKLALRKQLEKTLLQIPPPKPPPPEMHFIPNPNNTEFVYLLGLETVVDHLLPGNRKHDPLPPPPTPFICSQCKTDFSPVWKWDKTAASDKPSVMCDQCVTSSVKRALRAEHTARLKSAFMRALQQEQELEQHSARIESPSTPPIREPPPPPSPRPSPLASPSPSVAAVNRERERLREREMREKAREERQREKIERESRDRNRAMMDASPHMMSPSDFSKLMDPTKMFNHQAMAALQAAQQMILRAGMGMGSPQQMQAQAANPLLNPFNPLLYPYQLALAASAAQQVQGSKNNHQAQMPAMNHAALAELQRQILMEMIPTSLGHMPGVNQPSTSRQGSSKDRQRK